MPTLDKTEPQNDLERRALDGITTELLHPVANSCDQNPNGKDHEPRGIGDEEDECRYCRGRIQSEMESATLAKMWRTLALDVVRALKPANAEKFACMSPEGRVNVLGELSETPGMVKWVIGGK